MNKKRHWVTRKDLAKLANSKRMRRWEDSQFRQMLGQWFAHKAREDSDKQFLENSVEIDGVRYFKPKTV